MHAKQQHHTFAKVRRPWNDPVANPPKGHQAFLPSPTRTKESLRLDLETILPSISEEVLQSGKLVFHMVGDTGGIHGTQTQEAIAAAMEKQIAESAPADRPRFLYHLGDVVYFNGQPDGYQSQFYEPYQHLDYPIFAIPGNHDNGGDPKLWAKDGANEGTKHPLSGFMDNFCSTRAVHLFKHRTAMTQPYCYWTLQTPFFNIVGLNSNVDGLLDPPGTTEQLDWLTSEIKGETPTLIAVHHPPYSLDANHGGYGAIGEALAQAFNRTKGNNFIRGVFSGHVHNYQRFSDFNVPYVVAGAGGYANDARSMHHMAKEINYGDEPLKTSLDGVRLESFQTHSPGFLRVTMQPGVYTGEYFAVPFGSEVAQLTDTFAY